MHLRRLLFAACTVTCALIAVQPAFAQQSVAAPAASIVANARDGAPEFVTFNGSVSYKADQANVALNKYLALNPATDELRLKSADAASADINIARYTQFYKGIKVEHGSYIVASKNEVISYMSGNFYRPSGNVNTQPSLTEAAALQKALAYTGAQKYIWEVPGADAQLQLELSDPKATYAPKGDLVLIEDYFSGDVPDGILHLAYHFDVYAVQPLSRKDVYVDAVSGRILFTNAIIKHVQATGSSKYSGPVSFEASLNNGTYSLHDSTRGGGIHTYSLRDSTDTQYRQNVTSTTSTYASNVAIDAHWGAEKVYDYWSIKRGRLSYNNLNSALFSYVDYGKNYNNAFWGGTAMYYGNGSGRSSNGGLDPLVSLDICGHEIGHGVCQSTANLIYNRESGGMNEGFSDIWAAVIENYANPNETDATAKNRWMIGEEIASSPLRDMSNPLIYGDPDTYGGANWKFATSSCSPDNTTNDNCGVHSNSGVLNKWFYFLTEGGSGINGVGNGYGVAGIGIDTAAQIAYGTELSLTQTSNYATCRAASIVYATAQFGACSKVVEAVTRAWYAVNVGADYTTCTPQVSFATPLNFVSENAASADCAPSHTVSIPIKISGPAPVGGNGTVIVTVTGGTAIDGVDYVIPNPVVTFPVGGNISRPLEITVFDNGNTLDTGKYIELALTTTANGSDLTAAGVLTTTRVKIVNDDLAPVLGATEIRAVGTSNTASNITSPFPANYGQARLQYIVTADELLAAGIKPNATLTKLAFNVTSKVSGQSPYNDYTVQLGATSQSIFTTAFLTPNFTQVYNGNFTTTIGTNTIAFANNYVWDGSSNIVVEICFTNTSRSSGNDQVQGSAASGNRAAYSVSNAGTSSGCSLLFNPANVSNARPVMRFTQEVAPTPVETVAGNTRKWTVKGGDITYFYSETDNKLIAGLWNDSTSLGCVNATVTNAGIGFTPTSFTNVFTNVQRSLKEVTITPAVAADTAARTVFIYLTNDELAATPLTSIQMMMTTAATDAAITPQNTQIVANPIRMNGLDYKGFRGSFKGLGRFFLIDGNPSLAIGKVAGQENSIYVVNNPFRNELKLGYNLQKADQAEIKLLDITGKVVFASSQKLSSGKGQITLSVSNLGLANGNYVLQVVTSSGVATYKVLKN